MHKKTFIFCAFFLYKSIDKQMQKQYNVITVKEREVITMTMTRPNIYTVVVIGRWTTTDEYRGKDLKEAIKVFQQFDTQKMFKAYFFINDEMVEF